MTASQSEQVNLPDAIDKSPMIDALGRLDTGQFNWMRNNNPYRISGEKVLYNEMQNVKKGDVTGINLSDFSEFLSSTSLLQCSDAWSLLGRSIGSLLLGDVTSSLHLAYYAELRATMSLLAAEGIYIGINEVLCLNSNSSVALLKHGGTHKTIWPLLEQWRKSSNCPRLMRTIIKPYGTTLSQWPNNASSDSNFPSLDVILDATSLDQDYLRFDHELRNKISYRPPVLELEAEPNLQAAETEELVTKLWGYLEPAESNVFSSIDNELLVDALATTFLAISEGAEQNKPDWTQWIEQESSNVLSTSTLTPLKGTTPEDVKTHSYLLNYAEKDASAANSWIEIVNGMLSRALLLCRFATGAGISLINNANVSESFTTIWMNSLALGRGLLMESQDVESAKDLWSDVTVAIEEVNRARASNRGELLNKVGKYILSLSQLERVAVWSFAK